MALTITNLEQSMMGNKNVIFGEMAFDSSYALGGESLTAAALGLQELQQLNIMDSVKGFQFEYDYTNSKVKVLAQAPPLVIEEAVTVTSNVGTLKYPHAYIVSVSSGNTAYKAIPGSLTPVTETVAVSEPVWGERGTLTFLAGDSVTSCYVTYVTQAWKEVFDNRVSAVVTAGSRVSGHASLAFTAGTPDKIDLGEEAVAIESVTWNDNGTLKACKALYKGQDPATTETAIDFTTAGSTTDLAFREEDTVDAATDSVYITYIKKPSSGFLSDRFIEEDDLTPSTDVVTVSSGRYSSNLLLWGSCGDLAGPTTKFANLISSAEAVGTTATLAQLTAWGNGANTFTLGSDHGDTDHVKLSYIWGNPFEIENLYPLEVLNGRDLSGLTGIKFQAIGV